MNIYRTTFFSKCPINSVRITYNLTIETESLVQVEHIIEATDAITAGYHEQIADSLHQKFGGRQTINAFHHGVEITTIRE